MTAPIPWGLRWRDVLLVAVTSLVGAAVAVAIGMVVGPSYAATALVNAGPGPSASLPLDLSTDVTQRYVSTELIYIDTLSGQMSAGITAATGVQDPPPVLTTQEGDTNVVKLTTVGSDPEQAAAMANAAADVYIQNWRERTAKDPSATPAAVKSDRYVERASAQGAVKTTSTVTWVGLGLILGFAVGVTVVYLQRRRSSVGATT